MFSRNKEGNPSIQSRKHKLIYNRINFAPPPSPWHRWVFLRRDLSCSCSDQNSAHVASLLQGRGWFCVCLGCFVYPSTPHSHLYKQMEVSWQCSGKWVILTGSSLGMLSLFAIHGTELREFMQRKSSPGSC